MVTSPRRPRVAPAVFFLVSLCAPALAADGAKKEKAGSEPVVGAILGPTDDRLPTTDNCVGRLRVSQTPSGKPRLYKDCTAWLVSNGAILSARHCFKSSSSTLVPGPLQFAVPYSNRCSTTPSCEYNLTNNLTMNDPPAANQFAFVSASLQTGATSSNDWAVFQVGPTGGSTPFTSQNCFYRMTQSMPSAGTDVSVTGYGVSGPSPEFGYHDPDNYPNTALQDMYTQYLQRAHGDFLGSFSGNELRYEVDTQHGNSGSPVIRGTGLAIGIHTGSDPATPPTYNRGTSFAASDLVASLQGYPARALANFGTPTVSSSNVFYVDAGASSYTTSQGTVMNPYLLFRYGISSVSWNSQPSILSIVAATYNESSSVTVNVSSNITLMMPVGNVTVIF